MKPLAMAFALLMPLAQSLGGGAMGGGSLGGGAVGSGVLGGGVNNDCMPEAFISLDARRLSGSDSDPVTTLPNTGTGGSAWDVGATGTERPTLRTAGNCTGTNKQCIRFNDATDFLVQASATAATWTKKVFCVDGYYPDVPAGVEYPFCWEDRASRNCFQHGQPAIDGRLFLQTAGAPVFTIDEDWHSICFDVTDPTNIPVAIDGVAQTNVVSSATSAYDVQLIIGAYTAAGAGDYSGFELGRVTGYKEDPGKTVAQLSACGASQFAMGPTRSDVRFAMAPRYFGMEDVEQDVVGRSLVAFEEPFESEFYFSFSDTGTVPTPLVGRLNMTPANPGDYTLKANVNGVGHVERPYHVVNVGAASSFSVLLIGDSITAAQTYPSRVATQATGKVTMLGLEGVTGAKHEGHSGKTWEWFQTDPDSPLTDGSGTLDLASYRTSLGAEPDLVVWLLGTNQILNKTPATIGAKVTSEMAAATALLTGWHANTEHAFALTMPATTSQDAFTLNYGASTDRWTDWRENQQAMVLGIVDTFGDREGEGIFLIPTNTALQPEVEHGDYVATNAIHPVTQGYEALGDAVAAFLLWHYRT